MDCRAALFLCVAAYFTLMFSEVDGRNKKVVIHVPYKVKKIKHTHTIYKTIHHYHHSHGGIEGMYSEPVHHLALPSEEHEHFHHMHVHEDPIIGQHSQPVPGIAIPEFLPDVLIDVPDIPDVEVGRHHVPLFRQKKDAKADMDLERGRSFLKNIFKLTKDTNDSGFETDSLAGWKPSQFAKKKDIIDIRNTSPTAQNRIGSSKEVTL